MRLNYDPSRAPPLPTIAEQIPTGVPEHRGAPRSRLPAVRAFGTGWVGRSSFLRGVVLTFGTYVLQLVCGVGVSVLAARALGAEDLGRYSLAILFATFVITFSTFGLPHAVVFHVSRRTYPLQDIIASTIFVSAGIGLAAAAVGGGVAYYFGSVVLPGVPVGVVLLALLLVPVLQIKANLRAVLAGLQRFGGLSVATGADSVLKLVYILAALLLLTGGVLEWVAAHVLAAGTVGLVLGGFLWRRFVGSGWKFSRAYVRSTFSYGGKAFVGYAIQFLNYRVDMLILNLLHGPVSVGFYSVAVLFGERLKMISSAASVVLFPRVAAGQGDGDKLAYTPVVCRLVAGVSMVGAAAFFLVSEPLVLLLYSTAFETAVRPLQMLLPGIVAVSVANVLGNDFNGRGKPEYNAVISIVTLAFNIALLFLLVPPHGAVGAALATTTSYVLQACMSLTWYVRITGRSPLEVVLPRYEDLLLLHRVLIGSRSGGTRGAGDRGSDGNT